MEGSDVGGGYTTYTTMPIREVPYPHGLGKIGHDELQAGMERLLGVEWMDQAANEEAFWTPRYQRLLEKYLAPEFDPAGDIVGIARQATAHAHCNPVLHQRLTGASEAQDRYWAGLPTFGNDVPRKVVSWCDFPPEITRYADGSSRYGNGRHRLSYLRFRIQPTDPEFEVLVRIDHVAAR